MMEDHLEKAPEVVENQTEQVVEAVVDPIEQRKSDNLVQMRRKMEAAEEALKEERRLREEAERRSAYRTDSQVQPFDPSNLPDDPLDVSDEDYVQAKYVKNNAKKVQSELQELRQELALLRVEKVTEKMTDFDEVVSKDNLNIMKSLYPDEYEVIMSNNNLKSKSVTAYNMLIKYGIAESREKKEAHLRAVDNKIEQNKVRPGSIAAARVSTSPLTSFSRYDSDGRLVMTDADRDRINKAMRTKLGLD